MKYFLITSQKNLDLGRYEITTKVVFCKTFPSWKLIGGNLLFLKELTEEEMLAYKNEEIDCQKSETQSLEKESA